VRLAISSGLLMFPQSGFIAHKEYSRTRPGRCSYFPLALAFFSSSAAMAS
jgi:hypothetical protein